MITRRIQYEIAGNVVGPFLTNLDKWRKKLRPKKKGSKKEHPFGPPLESVNRLKDIMTRYYFQGRYADGAVPVAWVTSGFPVEIFRPLGFWTVYPENHAAICSVQRVVPELSDVVEKEGYARDLCGYARADIGSVMTGKTPVGRLPKPDLLACCTNICQTVLYWYRALAEHFKIPLVLIDTPYVYGSAPEHHKQYVKDQLLELLDVAQKITGKTIEPEALAEVTRKANIGSKLWGRCLDASKNKPAPWTGFDEFFHMAPIVSLRGSDECNDYYQGLAEELEDRVKRGIGGLKKETHRLMWDNLPIWFGVRQMADLLAQNGFNFVCTTYTNAWYEAGKVIDERDPLGSAAKAYTHIILNEDLPKRLALMKRLAGEYDVQGAVLHSDRSCKPYSIGQYDLKDRLQAEANIRVMVLEADHADPRAFSAEQADNRLTAFMESFA